MNEHKAEHDRIADEEAFEDFKLKFRGPGQAEDAYAASKIVAEIDARDAEKAKRRVPNKAAVAKMAEVLYGAVRAAAVYRNKGEIDADARALLVERVMRDAEGVPAAQKTKLKTWAAAFVDDVLDTGSITESNEKARTQSFEIADELPQTWEPESDRMTPEETAAILDQIPRA